MAYCTQAELENAISTDLVRELTDDTLAGSIVADIVTQAITLADAMVNAHVRARYDIPLATTPDIVNHLSLTLSTFNLYKRRANTFEMPAWLGEEYTEALRILKMIRDGDIDLDVEPAPTKSTRSVATYDGPDRLFTSDTMEKF